MGFLYKREADENELSAEARRVLSAVRAGRSQEEARVEAGVSAEDLRAWLREPSYRAAMRHKPPPAQVINMNDYLSRPRLGEPVEAQLTVGQQGILDRLRSQLGGGR